jgi:hypothetical protein
MNMKIFSCFFGTMFLIAALLQAAPAAAITVGQIDTFEDGTTDNWLVGVLGAPHPAPPQNISLGGPAGVDDNFLQLTAVGGAGAGSRLSVINLVQWSGNYLATGITAIVMDVKNLGPSDLALRLLVADPTGGPPNNEAFSTVAIVVPTGSDWTRISFPLNPSDLFADMGNAAAALANVTELRIFHSPTAVFPGPAVAASLGIDNITAAPAPASLLLLISGILGLAAWREK